MRSDPADLHPTVAARLRADGQRYTEGRRVLIEVLVQADRPLTIPEVLVARPHLAQSSVYRNLAVLERAAVVQRIVTSDEWARYELAEDLTEHHHHLICAQCGTVEDFVVPPEVEQAVDRVLGTAARAAGFTPAHHRLDLVGTCSSCT